MAWANGRGITREVVASPATDDWTWRISIARVDDDGAFSVLPGVDRALVIASGGAMDLRIGDRRETINRFESIQFSGDESAVVSLRGGPVDDVNLMVRRGHGHGRPRWSVEHLGCGAHVLLGDALAAVVLDGVVMLSTPDRSFPFTPKRERATRFDALLPAVSDDAADAKNVASVSASVTRDAVLAFAFLDERS